jgi:diacylglycerol kinase
VLALEIINTAIEKLSDIVNASIHPVIKQVKDLSAGAVLLASIMSFIIGCIIFLPKINLVIKYILK